MTWMEARALTISIATWGGEWRGRRVRFCTDAKVVVDAFNNRRSGSRFLRDELRHVAMLAALHDIIIEVRHVEGERNTIAGYSVFFWPNLERVSAWNSFRQEKAF